jgi:hypothetical protein
MATVLEEYNTEQRCFVRFMGRMTDSIQRILIKKYFLLKFGKCLSRKAVHSWVEKFCEGRSKVADDA